MSKTVAKMSKTDSFIQLPDRKFPPVVGLANSAINLIGVWTNSSSWLLVIGRGIGESAVVLYLTLGFLYDISCQCIDIGTQDLAIRILVCDGQLANATSQHIKDVQGIVQKEFSLQDSIMCTTCAGKSTIPSFLSCKDSVQNNKICTYATTPQIWDFGCDLVTFYTLLPCWLNKTSELTYWYPAKRYVEYGPYEFSVWGSIYGLSVATKVNISIPNGENIFAKDCLIQDSRTKIIIPEYCVAKHTHNCSVTQNELTRFCSSNCVYCSDSYNCVTTKSHCPKNNILKSAKYLPRDNACTVDFKTDNQICSFAVDMLLSFNNNKLFLTIYYPECLYNQGRPDYVYCFTDASEQLRKRVSLNVLFNSTSHSYSIPKNFIVYDVRLEKYMGTYWCMAKGTRENKFEYQSNIAIAFKTADGNEFAVRLKIDNVCNYMNCNSIDELNFLIDDLVNPIENNSFGVVRTMKVIEFNNGSFADIIIHVSTLCRKHGLLGDFYKLRGILKGYPDYITVLYCKSSEQCLPEVSENLTWPLASHYQTVLPSELCVQANGSPVTRRCEGNFLWGLTWSAVRGKCADQDFGEETLRLQSYLNKSMSEYLIYNVSEIVHNENLTLIDLYFVSQILEKSSRHINSTFLNASLSVVSGLLEKDLNLLVNAQEMLNITDSFLRTSEVMAITLTDTNSSLLTLQKNNIIFHSFNPVLKNASGFVMYKNHSIKDIPLIGNFDDIEDIENIKLALYVPSEDIQTILKNNLMNVSIVTVMYLNDRLFPSNSSYTAEVVINLNIPNYENYLKSPIPLLVRSDINANFNCAFWDYGSLRQPRRGNWSYSGTSYDGKFKNLSNLQICSYSHLTHLALLVLDKRDAFLGGTTDQILSVITAVGSLLSLLGILGIFLTSCLFRSWRDKTGTQILLHLSVATLLEITFMYLNGAGIFDCLIAGCVLQYVVISKFAWMLIYAYCQYLRFVRVFGVMPNHLVLKSIIFGWGFGIIPTIAVLVINPDTYYRDKFCYAQSYYLYLGFYLPIAIILIVNCSIFCKIMCEVTNNKLDKFHSANLKTQQIKLAIILFSVLGIPWIFGIISNLIPFDWLKTIFVYIFSITSIMQGFLMCLFYVIFNKETREYWKRFLFQKKKTYQIFSSKKTNSVSNIS